MPNTPRLRPPPQSVRGNTYKLGSLASTDKLLHFLQCHNVYDASMQCYRQEMSLQFLQRLCTIAAWQQ